DGALYEGEYGQDLYVDAVPGFDQDEGLDTDKLDLYDLVQAIDWLDMGGDVPGQLSELFDLERYLAFAATEITIGHWDGYAWTRNNFYLYQPTAESPWTFVPWGTDQTFADHLQPFGGDGRIEQICVSSPACRVLLGDAFYATLAHLDALDLGSLALEAHALIWEAALEDPRREYDAHQMATGLGNTIAFLSLRPSSVLEGLACLDADHGDEDGDGHSSCFGVDCDDGDPAVFPGAPELCNFRDDDCDGEVDEVDEGEESCPTCETVLTEEVGSVLLCRIPRNYQDAHDACLARGADLISIHSQEQQEAIGEAAYANYNGHLWIGLNDRLEEGTFAWTDGSPVDYENWNDNEPNDHGSGEDCGHLYEGNGNKWNDLPCHHEAGYLCRVPNLTLP
ncbi:MAG: lectin-like protein, partial [Myxococcota bacterium]|nr:lectin-like protein [Myxococcota bacterium]